MNKIQNEILEDHISHFKNNVYTSIKMLCPFMDESQISLFIMDIISKFYDHE